MGKIIAIALQKGGVGKTTTAVNLSASFAASDKRTLLLDIDISGAASSSLGLLPQDRSPGMFDMFSLARSVPLCTHPTELPMLEIVPMNFLSPAEEERMTRMSDNRMILRHMLQQVRDRYDYILIDCPPYSRGLMTAGLAAADSVLIPAKIGHLSIEAIDKLYIYLDWIKKSIGRDIAIEGIVRTMHETRTKISGLTNSELTERYGSLLLDTVIPQNSTLSESSYYGKPALLYNVSSRGALSYLALADEIVRRNN